SCSAVRLPTATAVRAGCGGCDAGAGQRSSPPAINEAVATSSGSEAYVDALSPVCTGRDCDYMRSGSLLYFDYGHFTQRGSDLAVRAYFPLYDRQSTALAR